ncbi:DciA family protein [Actinocrispum wychmicini]|uniref:DciA family protein n=1 Tax=Actinocrispum wychmicini TaxID=1213861 RepID=UPI001A9D60D6
MTTRGSNGTDSDNSPTIFARSDDSNTQGELRGSDLARAALKAAQEAAGTNSRRKKTQRQAPHADSRKRRRWSGAGADNRDPQRFGQILGRIATDRGWSEQLANGEVFGRWTALVGAEIAEHAKPLALRDGELIVQASSTAWATQLRLLQRQLLAKIAKGVGPNVVKRLKVHGPAAPSWRYGPRHVSGRGPRDTYG